MVVLERAADSRVRALPGLADLSPHSRDAQDGVKEPEDEQQAGCSDAMKAVEVHEDTGQNLIKYGN